MLRTIPEYSSLIKQTEIPSIALLLLPLQKFFQFKFTPGSYWTGLSYDNNKLSGYGLTMALLNFEFLNPSGSNYGAEIGRTLCKGFSLVSHSFLRFLWSSLVRTRCIMQSEKMLHREKWVFLQKFCLVQSLLFTELFPFSGSYIISMSSSLLFSKSCWLHG